MIRHCSLFRFAASVDSALIDEIVVEFRAMAAKLPYVRSAAVGRNIGFHEGNFDVAANIEFDSIDGYRTYCGDRTHLDFVDAYLLPHLQERVAVQFDLTEALSR